MKQVNFRLADEEYELLMLLAEQLNDSVPNLSKKILLENISDVRKKVALKAYEQKKIGLKKAWKLSGLTFYEFNELLVANDVEPNIPDDVDDKLINLALNIKKEDILKKK